MNSNRSKKNALIFFAAITTSQAAVSQDSVYREIWSPPATPSDSSAITDYISGAMTKLEEYVLREARNQLTNPTTIFKLGKLLGEYAKKLRGDALDSDAQKAEELLSAIDLDSAPFHVTDAGALNIKLKVQYSPTFGAATLSWDRVTNRYSCQTFTTFPFTVSEVWDEEAEYRVWVDGKLLAHFPRRLSVSSPASIGINFTYGTSIKVRPSLSLGTAPFDATTRVGPFYDFDASSIGRFGNYSVTAYIAGCGPNTSGPSWGSRSGQSQVALARDATGRPSFFPPAEYAARQSNGPWLGTQVATKSDSSGKLTVAVFERTSPNEYKHTKRFWVSVPDDYVVVGGGAVAANAPFGNLLTASNPTDDLRAWEVSAKDHYYSNP